MGTDTPGHEAPQLQGQSVRPRPAGKKLPERRQGFLIYLPQATHAKLKAEATRRVITMSELILTAVAQFLLVEEPSVRVSPPPEPFVAQYGTARPRPVPESPSVSVPEQTTFEVNE